MDDGAEFGHSFEVNAGWIMIVGIAATPSEAIVRDR
jgi:hypothetical protein